jgi:hypothetical protein
VERSFQPGRRYNTQQNLFFEIACINGAEDEMGSPASHTYTHIGDSGIIGQLGTLVFELLGQLDTLVIEILGQLGTLVFEILGQLGTLVFEICTYTQYTMN